MHSEYNIVYVLEICGIRGVGVGFLLQYPNRGGAVET